MKSRTRNAPVSHQITHLIALINLTLVVAVLAGCNPNKRTPNVDAAPQVNPSPSPSNTNRTSPPDISVEEFIRHLIDTAYAEEQKGMIRAWKKFPGRERYRVADPSDFKIPEWVSRGPYAKEIERAFHRPFMDGEIHNGSGYNFVLMVVDKTIQTAERFGVVIFIWRKGNEYDIYWLYQAKDLSRTTINRHSGNIYLKEYREDGYQPACDIKWYKSRGAYACID